MEYRWYSYVNASQQYEGGSYDNKINKVESFLLSHNEISNMSIAILLPYLRRLIHQKISYFKFGKPLLFVNPGTVNPICDGG